MDYSNFTKEQSALINEYCNDEMRKLKKVCHFVWGKENIPVSEYDDLYSDAMKVLLESVESFDSTKDAQFKTYLTNNVAMSYKEWYRNNYLRSKRSNLELDKNGKIRRDENGNPIIIKNVSFDAPTEDGINLKEKIESELKVEINGSANLENYLNSLSNTEKKIAELIIRGYELSEIKKLLHIQDKKFERCIRDMSSFEKHRILKHSDSINEEETRMSRDCTQTMEKSKKGILSISSVIKKIDNYTIRFDHPLQRESNQWANVMRGNLISDILQGNPIPALIFAEQVINGIAIIWDLDGKQRCTTAYSYANNGFKVSKNVRRWLIPYQTIIKDEDGKIVFDEAGFPQTEYREFDIRNKKFSDLPEELKEKFMDYDFSIEQYLNCSAEDIAYHIARYNDGKPMNTQQKGVIRLGEHFASLVKGIAAMPFFKEKAGYTVKECNNGTVNRVIVESIMNINFLDEWKKDQSEMCEFIRDNANEEVFDNFEDMVDRISKVADDETFDKFNSRDSFIWFGLFARFAETGADDEKFIEFMAEFSRSLHSKKIDGVSFDDLCVGENGKTRGTKDKYIVIPKMEKLVYLMNEFLHIENEVKSVKNEDMKEIEEKVKNSEIEKCGKTVVSEDKKTDENVLSSGLECTINEINKEESALDFVKTNTKEDVVEEDIQEYEEFLENTVRVSSPLYQRCKIALLAMVAYVYGRDQDEEFADWVEQYQNERTDFSSSQKENLTYIMEDFTNHMKVNAA